MAKKRVPVRQQLIHAKLHRLGHTRIRVWWEPIGPAFEMCGLSGLSGGYFFRSLQNPYNTPIGTSMEEALHNLGHYEAKRTC